MCGAAGHRGEQGRSAVLADPMGAAFGVWQPGRRQGLEAAYQAGCLCWAELYTPDIARAAAFYHKVLGWETSAVSFPGGVYTSFSPRDTGEEGAFGGMVPLADDPVEAEENRPHWLPYIGAEDPDAVVARAAELGGRVRMPATSVPGVGGWPAWRTRTARASRCSGATRARPDVPRGPARRRARPGRGPSSSCPPRGSAGARAAAPGPGVDAALIERFSRSGTLLAMHTDTLTPPDLSWQEEALCAQTGGRLLLPRARQLGP